MPSRARTETDSSVHLGQCVSIVATQYRSIPVLPDLARETSKWAYESKPKTSDFSGHGKNHYTSHTCKYHPAFRNVLNCIIAFIIVFICYGPFLF